MKKATRCLVSLAVASCLLLFVVVPRYQLLQENTNGLHRRQIFPPSDTTNAPSSSAADTSSQPLAASTSESSIATTTPSAVVVTTPTVAVTSAIPTSAIQTTPTATSSNNPQTSSANNPTSAAAAPINTSSSSQGSSASSVPGQVETIIKTATSSSSASPSATSDTSNSSGGLGTGSIVGLSVAGGVAVIGIIAFFVWKFTRKRFADFDDNEAIKWPDLNSHSEAHALPTHSTGRAGFGDDDGLTRAPSDSHTGYASSLATTSTPEFYANGSDPYAVPPLPHLNPNQPYHDDPGYGGHDASTFYDPYRGPVPNTFNEAEGMNMSMEGHPLPQQSGYGGEAIPMTQMTRTRSPGPQVGLGYDMARASPQPTMGRQSPGPQAAMGYGGQILEDRSRSPGPAMGLGGLPGRVPSPGPHLAYGGR